MTYIKRSRASVIDKKLTEVVPQLYTAQDLTYAVARLAALFIAKRGKSYETVAGAVGALEDGAEELHEHSLKPFIRRGGRLKGHITPEEMFGS